MKYIKPLKIITYIATVIICTYYSFLLQAWGEKKLHDYKRQLVVQTIEEDLAKKEINVKFKEITTKEVKTFSVEELRRAVWVLDAQNNKLQAALDTVRSALEYHQGEG